MKAQSKIILPVLLAWSLLGAATVHGESETRPPVPIFKPIVTSPWEASGYGLEPEVKVQVEVDELGRVASVEVLEIEPSTDFDEAFRRKVVETIGSWRYAPALEEGVAVPQTLEWSIQFSSSTDDEEEPPPRRSRGSRTLALLALDDAGSARARIFERPLEERKRILDELGKLAMARMPADRLRRTETARFVVLSDAPSLEAAETLANNLEATYQALDELFEPYLHLQPEPYKIVVALFRHRATYDAFAAEIRAPRANGLYRAPGFITAHLEVRTPEWVMQLLLHEATHAYVDRHLRRRGAGFPFWLNEGLAEYVALSQIKRGKLVPGKKVGSRFAIGNSLSARQKQISGWTLRRSKKLLEESEDFSFEEVLEADYSCYRAPQVEAHYRAAWLAVHFLRHGEDPWAENLFPQMLLYAAEGYPSRQVVEEVYGMGLDELEKRFERYVEKL
ncbi:MAG: energy transducer TonB [Acidobacteriota bacterium]|nr:energy transducer TonB [Acidobacteriota bacterium]